MTNPLVWDVYLMGRDRHQGRENAANRRGHAKEMLPYMSWAQNLLLLGLTENLQK